MDFEIVTAIVLAATQIFKEFGFNKRWTPVFAISLGIVINSLSVVGGVVEQALWGIVAGLAAMGVWSGTKTIIGK